jgi:hypothetical protein
MQVNTPREIVSIDPVSLIGTDAGPRKTVRIHDAVIVMAINNCRSADVIFRKTQRTPNIHIVVKRV